MEVVISSRYRRAEATAAPPLITLLDRRSLVTELRMEPTKSASTVLVRLSTLYGMLMSGSGAGSTSELVKRTWSGAEHEVVVYAPPASLCTRVAPTGR